MKDNGIASKTADDAFEFFKAECAAAVERTYEKLITGLEEMKGIERQRAIKERISGIRIRMRHAPRMDALDVAKWLDDGLEMVAQRRNDLP